MLIIQRNTAILYPHCSSYSKFVSPLTIHIAYSSLCNHMNYKLRQYYSVYNFGYTKPLKGCATGHAASMAFSAETFSLQRATAMSEITCNSRSSQYCQEKNETLHELILSILCGYSSKIGSAWPKHLYRA